MQNKYSHTEIMREVIERDGKKITLNVGSRDVTSDGRTIIERTYKRPVQVP